MKINFEALAKSKPKETIREHTDKLIECANILRKIYELDDSIYSLLIKACEYHDYGKDNAEFQKRIAKGYRFNPNQEIPHNLLSVYFIDENDFSNAEDYYRVFYAVLYHHIHTGSSINYILREKYDLLEEKLEEMQLKELRQRAFNNANKLSKDKTTILVKGLLHRCDYAASAGINVENVNDFLDICMENLLRKWQKRNENCSWNEMQIFCKNNQDKNIIITAPTGKGKTEASLLWIGNNKGIYVLPLRSAINSIFERICVDILENNQIDERIALLHSDNIGYLSSYENDNGEKIDINFYEYRSRVKQFTLPLTISTPDQLFDFVFRVSGYEMKLATASYSKIIIDEIQAYNATMLAYVIYGIHQIINMGGKVAIFTATLPGFVKSYLQKDINNKLYDFKFQDYSDNSYRHKICVFEKEIDVKDIIELSAKNIRDNKSNKILVICNTIKKSQMIYDDLINSEENNVEIRLLHSKFIRKDRYNLEKAITDDGKTYMSDGKTFNKKNVIWIATSVVEASLDIDFDYLFTELSDLNALFQRMGRCNRKGKKAISSPNCFIYTEIDKNIILKENGNKKGFIDERLYMRSNEALKHIITNDAECILTENLKNQLISEYFSEEAMKDSHFDKIYKREYKDLMETNVNENISSDIEKKFRNIISYTVIPKVIYEENKDIIDSNVSIIGDMENAEESKEIIWMRKQRAKNVILSYTVDVGYFDVFVKGKSIITGYISISKYQRIPIVKCNYGKRGFERLSKEQIKEITYEDDYGVFF